MTNHPHFIGLDLGTSAIKGVVTDAGGAVVCTAECPTHYQHPQEGWCEADPDTYLTNVFAVIRDLAERAPGPVDALAAAAASGNTLLTDADGDPLTTIINWMDRRTANAPPRTLEGLTVDEVRHVTGWPCLDSFPLAHLAWLKEYKPDVFTRASHYCMDTDWLLFKLTGKWRMDHSTATTFHLQDQVGRCYYRPFLERLGIPETALSCLVESGTSMGRLTPEAVDPTGLSAGTHVVTGCFDHPAAARAAGVLGPGQLMLSCGTSWVGFLPEHDRGKILDADLLCDPFLTNQGGPWGAMFSVPYIGTTIDRYVRDIIAPEADDPYAVFNEAAAAASGNVGLEVDLRKPVQPVSGSREAISRAVMEGAAHLLNEHLNRLGTRGFGFREAVLVGGPSKSAVWPDIIAEITGLELTVGSEHAGAKGAAMLAEIGTRVYQSKENTGTGSDGISTAPAPVTDKSIYDKELRDFLPPKIFDAHVHLFDRSCLKPSAQFAAKNTYEKFGGVFSKEQYLQWIERLFPEQQYRFNSFGTPSYDSDLDASAAYTGTVSDNQRFFGMALISPHDTLEAIRHRVETNRLIGYKPYLRFVDWKEPNDVTIHDMLTHEHMQFADERGLAITLHIPRSQRLADPLNQTQMVELCRRYPDTKIIFAHIGRAYYLRNVLGFLDGIAQCPNAYVDTAMVNHEGVLEYTFTHFPRERILFGSDAPIAFLYGKSVEINNQYAYLMAEDYEIGTSIYDAKAAVNFTTFYYEQLRGIKLAAERAGLSRNDVEGVFFNNADRLFRQVADRNYAKKIGRRPRPK